jgi:hypothetical protein
MPSFTRLPSPVTHREIRSDGTELPVYAQTWYPGVETQVFTHPAMAVGRGPLFGGVPARTQVGATSGSVDHRYGASHYDREMPDTPDFPPEVEAQIQQKQEEYQNAIQEYQKTRPGVSAGFGIDPGNDPVAREAVTRLMEKSIEQALVSETGQVLEPEDLRRIRAEVREQVEALLARNSTK